MATELFEKSYQEMDSYTLVLYNKPLLIKFDQRLWERQPFPWRASEKEKNVSIWHKGGIRVKLYLQRQTIFMEIETNAGALAFNRHQATSFRASEKLKCLSSLAWDVRIILAYKQLSWAYFAKALNFFGANRTMLSMLSHCPPTDLSLTFTYNMRFFFFLFFDSLMFFVVRQWKKKNLFCPRLHTL